MFGVKIANCVNKNWVWHGVALKSGMDRSVVIRTYGSHGFRDTFDRCLWNTCDPYLTRSKEQPYVDGDGHPAMDASTLGLAAVQLTARTTERTRYGNSNNNNNFYYYCYYDNYDNDYYYSYYYQVLLMLSHQPYIAKSNHTLLSPI